MIRYAFNSQIEPPAPFVNITLRHPGRELELRDLAAQIDTGADRTVIPLAFALALELPRAGSVLIGGVGGTIEEMDLFGVLFAIHDGAAALVEVLAHEGESWALLGRDLLNRIRFNYDGPGKFLEIKRE